MYAEIHYTTPALANPHDYSPLSLVSTSTIATRARRAAILHEINALTTDDRIQRGDPILIFYAGQGSTAPTPKGWESAGPKIQLLLPPRFSLRERKGQKVYGIPDRTLDVLLGRLASAKGDNIV